MIECAHYQYFSESDIARIKTHYDESRFSFNFTQLLNRHPYFANYQKEIQFMSYKTYFQKTQLLFIQKFSTWQLEKLDQFIVIAGTINANGSSYSENNWKECLDLGHSSSIHTNDSCAYIIILKDHLQQEILNLLSIKKENTILIFLQSLPQLKQYFAQFKQIDSDNYYIKQSKPFMALLNCISCETYQTRDIIFKENQKSNFLYIVQEGQIELSTFITAENNQTVMALIQSQINLINQEFKINLNCAKFNDLKIRVMIEILTKGQMFGETEFLEKQRRITMAICLCENTILYKIALNKIDFQDRLNRNLLYCLIFSQQQKKLWINKRIGEIIIQQVKLKAQEEVKRQQLIKAQYIAQSSIRQSRIYTLPQTFTPKKEEINKKYSQNQSMNQSAQNSYRFGTQQKGDFQFQSEYQSFNDEMEESETMKLNFSDYAQFNSNLHPNNLNLSSIWNTKKKLLMKISKEKVYTDHMNFLDDISDPKQLGRYKNFEGASSTVATYIKSLQKNVKQNFIIDDTQYKVYKQEKEKNIHKLQLDIQNDISRIHVLNDQEFLFQNDSNNKSNNIKNNNSKNNNKKHNNKRNESLPSNKNPKSTQVTTPMINQFSSIEGNDDTLDYYQFDKQTNIFSRRIHSNHENLLLMNQKSINKRKKINQTNYKPKSYQFGDSNFIMATQLQPNLTSKQQQYSQ